MRVLFLAALIIVQAGAQRPSNEPQHPFRSGKQLVEVDVRVLKDGRFVSDLNLADFELSEDGVPQVIESLTLIASDKTLSSGTSPEHAAGEGSQISKSPANVWLFVFDTEHLSPGGLQRTRDAVVTFIETRFQLGDLGGVMSEGNLINGRVTSDREELRKAAAAVKIPGDTRPRLILQREWPRLIDEGEAELYAAQDQPTIAMAVDRACKEAPEECQRPHGRETVEVLLDGKAKEYVVDARRRAARAITSVDLLSRALARVPGSKTVVFLSEGFRIQGREGELRLAVGQATRAGAHIYSIDARGLDRSAGAILEQTVAVDVKGSSSPFDDYVDTLNSLGVDTGGFAIRNENNFGRALDQIQQDTGTYYVIAYSPTNAAFDGKYRSIGVKVSRPGVKVRSRRGYLAIEPAALLTTGAAVPPKPTAPGGAGVSPKPVAATETGPKAPGGAGVSPKRAAEETGAKAEDLTASDVLRSLPSEPMPAVPAHIEATKLIDDLKSASSASARLRPGTGYGETSAMKHAAEVGWAAYEKGDVEAAAKELGVAAAAPDARPWVVYALGLSQFALRQHKDAALSWERVRREVPEFEPVYFNLADAYGLQQNDTAALKVLRDAETRWPKDAEVANAIGVIHVRRGSLDAAIDSFERATRVQPEDALGYFNLARTCQMRMLKSQRYDRQTEKWTGGDDDRRRAIAAYERYVKIGGPYERQAKEALASLAWK